MSQPIIWVSKGGMWLDLETAAQAGVSRSVAQKWIEEERVTVEGRLRPKNYLTQAGEYLCALPPEPKPLEAIPQEIPLTILYEDPYLLVVDKPRGMVVHPAAGNDDGTLVNALLAHCKDSLSGINGVLRPGIVHRIDKDTSGLLVVAKTDEAHLGLSHQLQAHTMEREYRAIVHGHLREAEGVIDAPIGRHPKERKKMAIVPNGRPAVTHYRVLEEYPAFSYIACRLETGRTHQIRVHMESIGHGVAGDLVYGRKAPDKGLSGQCLHARELEFTHPRSGDRIHLSCPLPDYFVQFLARLGEPEA
jgi:23S rRNA pseudouridine1911/1915/1917 synthase